MSFAFVYQQIKTNTKRQIQTSVEFDNKPSPKRTCNVTEDKEVCYRSIISPFGGSVWAAGPCSGGAWEERSLRLVSTPWLPGASSTTGRELIAPSKHATVLRSVQCAGQFLGTLCVCFQEIAHIELLFRIACVTQFAVCSVQTIARVRSVCASSK